MIYVKRKCQIGQHWNYLWGAFLDEDMGDKSFMGQAKGVIAGE